MAKLRSLPPLVRIRETGLLPRKPPKPLDPIYNTPEFKAWAAQIVARAGGQCEAMVDGHRCPKAKPAHRVYADHIRELRDGGSLLDVDNGQCLCASHHELKTAEIRRIRADLGSLTKPNLPKPTCRVKLICGPPAAGKSTHVRANAGPNDIIIDLDMIARQYGLGRHRPGATHTLLADRNRRLAALANEPASRVAWVIIGAPTKRLREWWCSVLGVVPDDLVLLLPTRTELRRRVMGDPDREGVIDLHLLLIDQWLAREIGVGQIYNQYNDLDM